MRSNHLNSTSLLFFSDLRRHRLQNRGHGGVSADFILMHLLFVNTHHIHVWIDRAAEPVMKKRRLSQEGIHSAKLIPNVEDGSSVINTAWMMDC